MTIQDLAFACDAFRVRRFWSVPAGRVRLRVFATAPHSVHSLGRPASLGFLGERRAGTGTNCELRVCARDRQTLHKE
jgi:hypothetical protein